MKHSKRKLRTLRKLIIVNLTLLILSLIWLHKDNGRPIAIAIAKSGQIYQMAHTLPITNIDYAQIEQQLHQNAQLSQLLTSKQTDFLNAIPLSEGEARYWQTEGCAQYNCLHLTFINYSDGGTIEAIVQSESESVIAHWQNLQARPAGSQHIVSKAIEIAAADSQVHAILGDIGDADPAMIPMSGWLMDDDCQSDWCVDLTYHDPNGTGRIFHVFVNMQQEKVARTFYTRGRPERTFAKPPEQRDAYTDGCAELHGWDVCWEMTGHDGLHFIDGVYNKTLIFSSAKITQVEAWYPSWPGGYRDEIGFSATVPPFDDTIVTDFGDGFEVRQLFTEFTSWPNCICCYRYEQIIRFYGDGRFEPRFVSHGPGCDDLSVYRPFWRIDLDLDGGERDEIWMWENNQWVEQITEFETYPFVTDISPDGFKLATLDGDTRYRWRMLRTDPLRLDEVRVFGLLERGMEGDGPTLPGPGDTFQPPREWLNDESLSGKDIVLWFVPLLKTKRGGPWWCMPDPEPEFSPCEAIIEAVPSGELVQPSADEILEAALATAVAEPIATLTPAETPQPTPTPRPIDGESPEEIILNSGCGACHAIGALGEKGKVGPDLTLIGSIAETRVEGMSAESYLRQSILLPNAYIPTECPNSACLANIMPQDYATRLTPKQVETMVLYLANQTVDNAPTPTAPPPRIGEGDSGSLNTAPKVLPLSKQIIPDPNAPTLPYLTIQILLVSLVLLLSLFLLFKQKEP